MKKPTMVITGMSGLVGSYLKDFFAKKYEVIGFEVSDPVQPVDITNERAVEEALDRAHPEVLIHCAAFTDVTAAWQQQRDRDGLAYRINVKGTEIVARGCAARNIHLIHLSTAYVFDGTKETLYTEADSPNPIEWYGQTKLEAEEKVLSLAPRSTLLRIDQPFRLQSFPKPDAVRKMISLIEKGMPLFSDHYFGPTVIEDLALIIESVIKTSSFGLFHASSGEKWSDFSFGSLLNEVLLNSTYTLSEGSLEHYLKTTNRPYQKNTALDTQKLKTSLPLSLQKIQERLSEVIL